MNLILTEIKRLKADEDMRCDASEIYWSLPRPLDYSFARLADAILLFKGRYGKIRKGESYLRLIFADSDTGEQELEFNCLESINKLLFGLGLYPEEINDALLEYRKAFKLKQVYATK